MLKVKFIFIRSSPFNPQNPGHSGCDAPCYRCNAPYPTLEWVSITIVNKGSLVSADLTRSDFFCFILGDFTRRSLTCASHWSVWSCDCADQWTRAEKMGAYPGGPVLQCEYRWGFSILVHQIFLIYVMMECVFSKLGEVFGGGGDNRGDQNTLFAPVILSCYSCWLLFTSHTLIVQNPDRKIVSSYYCSGYFAVTRIVTIFCWMFLFLGKNYPQKKTAGAVTSGALQSSAFCHKEL